LSSQFAATPSRRFKFEKRCQLFIRVHNEKLFVVAMRVSYPDCSPVDNQWLTAKRRVLIDEIGRTDR
jgi:hypothetical protein